MPRNNKDKPNKSPKRRGTRLNRVNPNSAGIDCGASAHYVAVSPSVSEE